MLTITEKAVSAVKDYLKQENKEHFGLRIVAQEGCCSMQYGFELAEQGDEHDTVLEHDGVSFFVDPQSSTKLSGAKVDFMTGGNGEGFYIENPNEPQFEGGGGGCGCGGGSCGCGGSH